MSTPEDTRALGRLAELRHHEVDRLNADMAARHATSERYRHTIARMEHLYQDAGARALAAPRLSAALLVNCAQYKQAVLHLADQHRQDLSLHEADTAVARRSLHEAERRREVLDQLLANRLAAERHAQAAREQKRQDDLATQVWLRGQAGQP